MRIPTSEDVDYSGATGRGPPLLGARDPGGSLGFPWFSLVFVGFPWFFLGFSLVFLGFQSLWFSTRGSLDSSLTVLQRLVLAFLESV